jgi:hypothetical protein
MFKKGDKVIHSDYGAGVILAVNQNNVMVYKDKNNHQIHHKGTIEVMFDSDDEKAHTILSDGRELPIGSGYFWNSKFNEYDSSIKLFKVN